MIFGVILPFITLVIVGGLLAFLLVRRGFGEVKGIWQTTGSKNTPKASYEKPQPQEVKPQSKPPPKQNTHEENLPANTGEENSGLRWRW